MSSVVAWGDQAPLSVMAADTCAAFARRQKGEQAVCGGGCSLFFFFFYIVLAGTSPPMMLGRCAPMSVNCSFFKYWTLQSSAELAQYATDYWSDRHHLFFFHSWNIHRRVWEGWSAVVCCPSGLWTALLITGPLNSFGAGEVIHCWTNNWTDWVQGSSKPNFYVNTDTDSLFSHCLSAVGGLADIVKM